MLERKIRRMVGSLKQAVKQVLIQKEHKKYEKQLSSKKLTYAAWIEKQESKLQIENIIVLEQQNCQTNDPGNGRAEGDNIQNERFLSKNVSFCRIMEAHAEGEKNGNQMQRLSFLQLPYAFFQTEKKEKSVWLSKRCGSKKPDVILLTAEEGELAEICIPLLFREFREKESAVLVYGDEDVREEGIRKKPWFKPDWSPDTFLSSFYFGSLVAVRMDALLKAMERCEKRGDGSCKETMYEILKELLQEAGAFSVRREENSVVRHIPEVLFHGCREGYEIVKDWKLPEGGKLPESGKKETGMEAGAEDFRQSFPLISVIIPSKDNPGVLFTCVRSILDQTRTSYPYEIVIVDNGSSQANKERIQDEIKTWKRKEGTEGEGFQEVRYLYRPMPFNFSHMCNLGAEDAKGGLLLFLNDDMEVIQSNWLTALAQKASLSYAGAVGAKLLYPDSDILQHAGITNLRVGPAHKLQFLPDKEDHYYGRNRGVHDMLAVTGACLMVKREVFHKAGGFAPELAVAFNDVDLCYTIYEAGYYNMVRNDVVLYHHESLSRGKDGESEEKQLRLLREKDILYERHQKLYGKDPFYHKYLTTDMLESEYSPAYRYQVTLDMPWAKVTGEEALAKGVREDGCVVIGMECAMDLYKWKHGVEAGKAEMREEPEDMGYYFQGYSFVIGSDNACYKKTLLLQNREDGRILKIPVDDRYRQDIRDNLKDQLNVDLTGFAAKVRLEQIPAGNYRFGMLMQDKCSRQQLVNWSSWTLAAGCGNNHGNEEKHGL